MHPKPNPTCILPIPHNTPHLPMLHHIAIQCSKLKQFIPCVLLPFSLEVQPTTTGPRGKKLREVTYTLVALHILLSFAHRIFIVANCKKVYSLLSKFTFNCLVRVLTNCQKRANCSALAISRHQLINITECVVRGWHGVVLSPHNSPS